MKEYWLITQKTGKTGQQSAIPPNLTQFHRLHDEILAMRHKPLGDIIALSGFLPQLPLSICCSLTTK
jgi:hypothetical protein